MVLINGIMLPDLSETQRTFARLAALLIPQIENGHAQILMAKFEQALDSYNALQEQPKACPHCGALLMPVAARISPAVDEGKRYNREQAAEFLLVNVKTVSRWRKANLLPFETGDKGEVYYVHGALLKRFKEYRGVDKA